MKISVLGSINMDMTVKVDRIPLKGETLEEKVFHIYLVVKVQIRQLQWQD